MNNFRVDSATLYCSFCIFERITPCWGPSCFEIVQQFYMSNDISFIYVYVFNWVRAVELINRLHFTVTTEMNDRFVLFWLHCSGKLCMYHGPLTIYGKLRVVHAPEMAGTFPRHWLQRKPLVSDSSMHYGTCVTHVPWCMSGALTCGGRENVPGIPLAHTQPAILRIWHETHVCFWAQVMLNCQQSVINWDQVKQLRV